MGGGYAVNACGRGNPSPTRDCGCVGDMPSTLAGVELPCGGLLGGKKFRNGKILAEQGVVKRLSEKTLLKNSCRFLAKGLTTTRVCVILYGIIRKSSTCIL